ncbi:hypothetical protein [Salipaludibacillus agaradhaerens]|uniref:hypothetical protein n=1 Tax=Salipaludibacillus agaradhaerens TaxID=76935 RepID=UPI0009962C9B|nr:hypothetical protein [Salipaludibacillus agaradhaerens]
MLVSKLNLLRAFPVKLQEDVMVVLNMINEIEKLDFLGWFEVNFSGSVLNIPERIYYDEPSLSHYKSLSEKQQVILNCLFTRHHNGYIREQNLKRIIEKTNGYNWIIPYLMRITGEYVIEILQVIKVNLDKVDKGKIKDFINENPIFCNTIESRVSSYWNCYYRVIYPNKNKYVGFKIIEYFKS